MEQIFSLGTQLMYIQNKWSQELKKGKMKEKKYVQSGMNKFQVMADLQVTKIRNKGINIGTSQF